MAGYNEAQFNEDQYNQGAAAAAALAEAGRTHYTIEVCDGQGVLLRELPYWVDATLHEKVNTFPTLQFDYPYNDSAVSNFALPNTLALRDTGGNLLGRFVISKVTKIHGTENELVVRVLGEGLLEQLGREYVNEYDTDGTPVEVQDIAADLLSDHQNNSVVHGISIGTIDAAIGEQLLELKVDNKTILNGLRRLQRQVGGYISVNDKWQLNWTVTLESSVGQEIVMGHNMQAVEIETDYRTIKNRLLGKGRGVAGIGEAATEDEFMLTSEKTDAGSIATYGQISDAYSAKTVHDQDELDNLTAARVDITAEPSQRVKAQVIDLSHYDGPLDYSHEALKLGARVALVDSNLSEIITTNIIDLKRTLDWPMGGGPGFGTEITVSNPDAGSTLYPSGGSPEEAGDGSIIETIADIIEKLIEGLIGDTGVLDGILQYLTTDADALTALQGALLSDAVPQDVGAAGAAGTGTKALRSDAVHAMKWLAYSGP